MSSTREPSTADRARVRHKYWLLERWEQRLEGADAPGGAHLVTGYRPSGFCAPTDVSEIAGLIVLDADRTAHHFRLRRDETAQFIESPSDPEAPIAIDPMSIPVDTSRYLSTGVPPAVTEHLEALEVTPTWERACEPKAHDWEVVGPDEDTPAGGYRSVSCERCELPGKTLSWLGHGVPRREEL